jgi:hypothetical protein
MATPTFEKINEAEDLKVLKTLAPSTQPAVKRHLPGRSKCIAIPPLLRKVLMDADSEDPYMLLKTCCKALVDSNNYGMEEADTTESFSTWSSFYFMLPAT